MATNTSILGLSKPAYTDDADVAVINSNSDLIDAEAGRTRANFAAEYSTSSAYAVGAFCTHAGILYQCNTAIGSGGEAWTAAHWTQISAGDAIVANTQAIATLNGNKTNYSSTTISSYAYTEPDAYAALFAELPNKYKGTCSVVFKNGVDAFCIVNKFSTSYGTVITMPDSGNAIYAKCSNGTWTTNYIALQ
jgi:hypothetical protein